MLRKNHELLLQPVPEFTVPCGDILFDTSPLKAMLFYLDGHMSLLDVMPAIIDKPKKYLDSVYEQCCSMQGGGADIVKMTRDPRTVPFVDVTQFVEVDLTFPLLENNNGIIYWNGQFFYANKLTHTVELLEPRILVDQQEAFNIFKDSINVMEDNSSRRSTDDEYEFITKIMGLTLERHGIRYERENVIYQDTKVGLELSNAYRKYLRLYKEHVNGTPWDDVDAAWLAVGWMQRKSIPMLQRMCEVRTFYPLPSETSFKVSPFNRSFRFSNWNSQVRMPDNVVPLAVNAGLGVNFTLYKGWRLNCTWAAGYAKSPFGGAGTSLADDAARDLAAHWRIVKVEIDCISEFLVGLNKVLQSLAAPAGCIWMERRTFLGITSDKLIKQELINNLDAQSLINLTQINKRAHNLFKPTSLPYQYLKKFVERSAKKQISTMFTKSQIYNVTFNQLVNAVYSALRLGDIDLIKVLIKGREGEFKQIQLPKKLFDETNTYDFRETVSAIKSGKDVETVLAQVRADLDKIVKERGFPFQALSDALKIYEKDFDPEMSEQCKIFSINVIGYLQRLSPAWFKKEYANGLQDGGNTFTLKSGESIDPVRDIPNAGLGFHFCVDLFGRAVTNSLCFHGRGWVVSTRRRIDVVLNIKTEELNELCNDIPQCKILP